MHYIWTKCVVLDYCIKVIKSVLEYIEYTSPSVEMLRNDAEKRRRVQMSPDSWYITMHKKSQRV